MKTAALFLIVLLLLVIGAIQVTFFIWIARQMKKQQKPVSHVTYRSICFGIGGVLFAVALITSIHTIALLVTGVKTTGVVIELREHEGQEDHTKSFAPTFTFVDQSGATNQVESGLYGSPDRYKVGERIPVIYKTSNPHGARINRFAENWFVSIATSIAAAVALASIPIRNKWVEFRLRKNKPPTQSQLARL